MFGFITAAFEKSTIPQREVYANKWTYGGHGALNITDVTMTEDSLIFDLACV